MSGYFTVEKILEQREGSVGQRRELPRLDVKKLKERRQPVVSEAMAIMTRTRGHYVAVYEGAECLGAISRTSILDALCLMGASITFDQLALHDVLLPYRSIPHDEVLDDVMEQMHRHPVLFVKRGDQPDGAVTREHLADFYRGYARDVMRIETIETGLRKLMQEVEAHENLQSEPPDKLGEEGRHKWFLRYFEAVKGLCPADIDHRQATGILREKLSDVKDVGNTPDLLAEIVSLVSKTDAAPDREGVAQVFRDHCYISRSEYGSLNQLIEQLMKEWEAVETLGGSALTDNDKARVERKKRISEMLQAVRSFRNRLAHYRDPLMADERRRLKYAEDWIARLLNYLSKRHIADEPHEVAVPRPEEQGGQPQREAGESAEGRSPEPIDPDDSPYSRLARYLRERDHDSEGRAQSRRLVMPFHAVEAQIQGTLPKAARRDRDWWSNDKSNEHARAWLDAGWRMLSVNMSQQVVTFCPVEERDSAYIDFFGKVKLALAEQAGEAAPSPASPTGKSWLRIEYLRVGKAEGNTEKVGQFNVAFGFRNRVRSELYIDSGDGERNNEVFKQLEGVLDDMEIPTGAQLVKSPLDENRACRIALVREGSIDDLDDASRESLAQALAGDILALRKTITDALGPASETSE